MRFLQITLHYMHLHLPLLCTCIYLYSRHWLYISQRSEPVSSHSSAWPSCKRCRGWWGRNILEAVAIPDKGRIARPTSRPREGNWSIRSIGGWGRPLARGPGDLRPRMPSRSPRSRPWYLVLSRWKLQGPSLMLRMLECCASCQRRPPRKFSRCAAFFCSIWSWSCFLVFAIPCCP